MADIKSIDRVRAILDPGTLVVLLSIPAVFPLLNEDFFISHDGLFHLYRLAALDRALRQGVIYPRWFPDFAYGYGHPVLNYYSPLAYYVGQIFHLLGAGYILSTRLTFLAGFLLAGLAIYLLARDLLGRFPALVAAVAYTYAPYHLADTYLRGALAESLAFLFMPLALWAIGRLFSQKEVAYALVAALAYGGLILTHNLTALIFAPLFLAYALLRALIGREFRSLALVGLALLLALGLTAFYWLPALTEAPWVGLAAGFASTGYRDHLTSLRESISPFLLYRYFPNQAVKAEHPLGLIHVFLLLVSMVAVFRLARIGQKRTWWQMALFLLVAALSFFMTLTYSLPLWKLLEPLLAPLQYPWRFMGVASLGVAFLAGGVTFWAKEEREGGFWGYPLGLSLMALSVISGLAHLPLENLEMAETEVTVARMWEEDFAHRQIGTTWTAEYLPIWVRADRSEISLPPSTPKALDPRGFEVQKVVVIQEGYLWHELEVKSARGTTLRFHTFYFPGWQGYADKKKVDTYPSGEFGLVTVEVPAGEHKILLRFEETRERKVANAFSLATSILLVVALLKYGPKRYLVIVFSIVLLLGGLLAWHLRPFGFVTRPIE
ncbi:MAG: 6-pyruvoyl-tetrahydropterin synthase-related protein, partial [Anaerolineae bacterium]